jgi:shikimate kinase
MINQTIETYGTLVTALAQGYGDSITLDTPVRVRVNGREEYIQTILFNDETQQLEIVTVN